MRIEICTFVLDEAKGYMKHIICDYGLLVVT